MEPSDPPVEAVDWAEGGMGGGGCGTIPPGGPGGPGGPGWGFGLGKLKENIYLIFILNIWLGLLLIYFKTLIWNLVSN